MESDGRGDAAAGVDAAGGMERLEREAIGNARGTSEGE